MGKRVADIIAGLPPNLIDGRVGFFWIVPDRFGGDALLASSMALANAEIYGEALTHPGGHYVFWENMRVKGAAWLRTRNFSLKLLKSEYENWPRGRVVFHLDRVRFSLMADPLLHIPTRIALITAEFRLPVGHYDVSGDGHYRTTRNGPA